MGPDAPLMFEPGGGWTYGVGIDWAGELVAAVTGRTLDVYLADEVFAPLGMSETGFAVREAQRGRAVSMHARGADGALAVIAVPNAAPAATSAWAAVGSIPPPATT